MKQRILVLAVGLCVLLSALPASAQIARLAETFLISNGTVRGTDVAYDSRNGVYLVVSAHGLVTGRFVTADGGVIGQPFLIQDIPEFGQFPHVAYSPDANGGNGGFLVTWLESDVAPPSPGTSLHARMIGYPTGYIGAEKVIVGADTYWELMGAPVAYSTVSREFLVVWRQYSDVNLFGIRLNNNGDQIGNGIPLATTPAFESDPALTYNPSTDEFFAVYRFGPQGSVSVMGQRIKAGTGALLGGPTVIASAADIRTTGVTYNPTTGQYQVAWHQIPPDAILGRIVNANGAPAGNVAALSTRFGTYDSLSVAANAASGTVLMAGHDHLSVESGGAEVLANGAPVNSTGMVITAGGGNGNFYPRVSANAARKEWLVSAANQFARTIAQRMSTTSNGGGGGGGGNLPPDVRLAIDQPYSGSTMAGTFTVSGWAIDLNAPAGNPGVDAVHVHALPDGGAAQFVGAAAFVARPDLADYFQQPRFAGSGFSLQVSLAPGNYTLVIFARSVLTGVFEKSTSVRVAVVRPVTQPLMAIDQPLNNLNWPAVPFAISGWAVDRSAASGTGISQVDVWAYPRVNGVAGAPIWIGTATMGVARPDVAAAMGSGQFTNSGYFLLALLPRGTYDIVIFSKSTITGTFNYAGTRINIL